MSVVRSYWCWYHNFQCRSMFSRLKFLKVEIQSEQTTAWCPIQQCCHSLSVVKGLSFSPRLHLQKQCHLPLHHVAWHLCRGSNAYLGKWLCSAMPTNLWGMPDPAAPYLASGCWNHYINNPEVLVGNAHWWPLLATSWELTWLPVPSCWLH